MRADLYQELYRQEEYYWWQRAKRELVKQFLPAARPLRILDVGCGTGKLLEELTPWGETWGIDTAFQAVSFCRQRGLKNIFRAKFPNLPRLSKFDVITCLDVLEHIEDDSLALLKLKSLLNPGGRLILILPAHPWLFSYWDEILGHYRRYTKTGAINLLEKSGYKIIKLSYLYTFLLPAAIIFRKIRQLLFKHQKSRSDFIELPGIIHTLLFTLASFEHQLLKLINLPFGLSLLCIVQKP